MCGIFAYTGNKSNGVNVVLEGLKKLEYRGYDSWGIAASFNGQLVVKKKTGSISKISLEDMPPSNLVLGHTRWATHGGVTDSNAHPHLDCTKRFALVHNGIVENYQDLASHLNNKHHISSQTDTEIIVHLIEELAIKHTGEEAVRWAFNKLEGLNAIVVLDSKDGKIYAAKTGSPLILTVSGNEGYLASDSASLLDYNRHMLFLADNEMAIMSGGEITVKNVLTGSALPLHMEKVDWKISENKLGHYPYFMAKEIREQPKIILSVAKNLKEEAQNLSLKLKDKNLYLTGCGSAYYAGLAGSYLLSSIAKVPSQVVFGSETELLGNLDQNDSLLVLSQSGETIDLVEAIKNIKPNGTKIVAIVNTLGSTIYRMGQEKILLGAGPERCVLATKSYIAKLAFLILLAYSFAGKEKDAEKLLRFAAEGVEEVIAQKAKVSKLAAILVKKNDIFVIGRGLAYPIALESALKIKEVTYHHAEGFAAGELKHGVIALIKKGTPCIAIALNDSHYQETISSSIELKARGAYIVGISPKNNEVFDMWLPIPDIGVASIIPAVVYSQMLGYNMALKQGLNPDKPRNLAKSVTVK